MKRQDLINVYKDTQRLAKDTTSHNYKQSEKWNFEDDLPPYEELDREVYDKPAKVTVVNADTLTTAMELADQGLNPLVLNMASDIHPGGGVAKGSRAQEEELFRRTNYFWCTNKSLYPIKDNEFIITENVAVIKDEDYNRLRDYYQFDFIAMAAVRKPSISYESNRADYMDNEDRELMRAKIDAIFRYAAYQQHESLVLGALGCGAFGNPPYQVCNMFRYAIARYSKCFTQITFAVQSGPGNPNYDVFSSLRYRGEIMS